jgi:hypothetical protein
MRVGICGPNDHHYTEADYRAIREARFELIKTMSFTSDEAYRRCREINPAIEFIVRLYSDGGGHPGSPERFVELHAPRMESLYRQFGIRLFQVHNEPNHWEGIEGWGQERHHAEDFSNWFIRVYSLLKARCPWARLGFPGLAVPHKDKEWLDWCRAAILMADWLGLHVYWQTPPGAPQNHLSDYWGKRFLYYSATFPSKDIHILEYGNSNGQSGLHLDDHERARQYVEWFQMARKYPYLKSASSFILSSPDPRWHREGFGWTDRPTLIAAFRDMPRGAYTPPAPTPTPLPKDIPMRVITNKTAHFWVDRGREPLTTLVLHGTDDPHANGTTHTSANYLAGQNSAGVSSHEVVGYEERNASGVYDPADYLYILLPQARGSNCVGFSRLDSGATGLRANQQSYNIEAQHKSGKAMHPRTYAMLIERAVEFCIRNKWTPHEILNPTPQRAVRLHGEVDTRGKTCPGPSMHRRGNEIRQEIADVVRAKTGTVIVLPPPPAPDPGLPIPGPETRNFSLWADRQHLWPRTEQPTDVEAGTPVWRLRLIICHLDGRNEVRVRAPEDHFVRVVDETTGKVIKDFPDRVITLGGKRSISIFPGKSSVIAGLDRHGVSYEVWFEYYHVQPSAQRAA